MKARIVVVLGVTLSLALPVAAQAKLPKTSDKLIVPAKSIGGVALGSPYSAVTKDWGKNSTCEPSFCTYEGKTEGEAAGALLESVNGTYKVWRVYIAAAQVSTGTTVKPELNTPLTRFKTSKGIGIGSTVKALRKAYHGAKEETANAYVLSGPKESLTVFGISAGGVVESISISSHPGG